MGHLLEVTLIFDGISIFIERRKERELEWKINMRCLQQSYNKSS
jgi:hypothetical protein